ncbi:MAG: PAS domain-containing protein, partial [Verrucomicrobia bacterium]|nr:PAS domain-containing protein [Verrucomicrobiota bacterium]
MNNQASPFDDLIDNVIISSPEGLITEINLAALNLLGCGRKEDLLGRPMGKVCRNFSLEKITANLPLENYEMIYVDRREKEIPVHVNITARRDRQAALHSIIFSARDMSKTRTLIYELTQSRKKLESSYADLRASKDDVVRSEKLAFTGRIAASIAHEIRNPLTNVIMSVQRLAKAIKANDPNVKHVEIVLRNAERINYLITELLNCARPPKLDMRACDIHKLLANVLESTRTKIASQKIKVAKRFTSKPAIISIDKEQMERALLNLIINAVEAMPKAGQLTIMTEYNENVFVVKIQDTGKGIPDGDVIRIFDPFFSS